MIAHRKHRAGQLAGSLTTASVAAALAVSERSVRRAKSLRAHPDLAMEVQAGRMSLHAATPAATGKLKPTGLDRLRAAYRAATIDERAEFIADIIEMVEAAR